MALATRTKLSPAEALHATPPRLDHAELRVAQHETMHGPRLRYDVVSRILFAVIDLTYGRAGSLRKFRALELLARVPYHAWERAAYRAAGRLSHRTAMAATVHRRIVQSRAQQDNEQWHLFALDEALRARGEPLRWFRDRVLPRLLAAIYHPFTWLVLLVSPPYSYRLNAAFEDYAEHQYMAFVAHHPHLDQVAFTSQLGDVFSHVHRRRSPAPDRPRRAHPQAREPPRGHPSNPMPSEPLTLRERAVIVVGLTALSLLAALAERLDQRDRRRRTTPSGVHAEASRQTTTAQRLLFRMKPCSPSLRSPGPTGTTGKASTGHRGPRSS